MFFHRANRIKPGQEFCLEQIEKITEILRCTVSQNKIRLTINELFLPTEETTQNETNLLRRSAENKNQRIFVANKSKRFSDGELRRIFKQIDPDRRLFTRIDNEPQSSNVFPGSKVFFEKTEPVFSTFQLGKAKIHPDVYYRFFFCLSRVELASFDQANACVVIFDLFQMKSIALNNFTRILYYSCLKFQ